MPLRELALIDEVPPTHPLNERLYEWKAIAERGQLAELFDRLLHQSGLAYRELFLSGSERRLTNYLHIFEILLRPRKREPPRRCPRSSHCSRTTYPSAPCPRLRTATFSVWKANATPSR